MSELCRKTLECRMLQNDSKSHIQKDKTDVSEIRVQLVTYLLLMSKRLLLSYRPTTFLWSSGNTADVLPLTNPPLFFFQKKNKAIWINFTFSSLIFPIFVIFFDYVFHSYLSLLCLKIISYFSKINLESVVGFQGEEGIMQLFQFPNKM